MSMRSGAAPACVSEKPGRLGFPIGLLARAERSAVITYTTRHSTARHVRSAALSSLHCSIVYHG